MAAKKKSIPAAAAETPPAEKRGRVFEFGFWIFGETDKKTKTVQVEAETEDQAWDKIPQVLKKEKIEDAVYNGEFRIIEP